MLLPNSMIDPEITLDTIPAELDATGWKQERNHTDVAVYTRMGASNSPVIGFKTITQHPFNGKLAFDMLKDVCYAMQNLNHMYLFGKKHANWPTKSDPNGVLVGTYFHMPVPFTNREFIHGLHHKKLDEHTWIVGYTPTDAEEVPVEGGFRRCKTYISGQRITSLQNGLCQVEHLMVYELGGKVSLATQDKWLKSGHINAYIKEWRALRTALFPTAVTDVDNDQLTLMNQSAMLQSSKWPTVSSGSYGRVSSGRLTFCPVNAFRLDYKLDMPLGKTADFIGYRSLEYLPKWNEEFKEGSILETLSDTKELKAWIVRVRYGTPFFLDDREYVYYFSVSKLSDTEIMINYQSVDWEQEPPGGVTRALLYPSVHYLKANGNTTTITHILATDLQGKLQPLQSSLLKGGLASAQVRDIKNQLELTKALA